MLAAIIIGAVAATTVAPTIAALLVGAAARSAAASRERTGTREAARVDKDRQLREDARKDVDILDAQNSTLTKETPVRVRVAEARSHRLGGSAVRGKGDLRVDRVEFAVSVSIDVKVGAEAEKRDQIGGVLGVVGRADAVIVRRKATVKERTRTKTGNDAGHIDLFRIAAVLTDAVFVRGATTNSDVLGDLDVLDVPANRRVRTVDANREILKVGERVTALTARDLDETQEAGRLEIAAAANRAPLVGIALLLDNHRLLDDARLRTEGARGAAVLVAASAGDGRVLVKVLSAATSRTRRLAQVALAKLSLELAPLDPVVIILVLGPVLNRHPAHPVLTRVGTTRNRSERDAPLGIGLPVAVIDVALGDNRAPANVVLELNPLAMRRGQLECAEADVLPKVGAVVVGLASRLARLTFALIRALLDPGTRGERARIRKTAIHGVNRLVRQDVTHYDTRLGLKEKDLTVSETRVGAHVLGTLLKRLGDRTVDVEELGRSDACVKNRLAARAHLDAVARVQNHLEVVEPAVGAVLVVGASERRLSKVFGVDCQAVATVVHTAIVRTKVSPELLGAEIPAKIIRVKGGHSTAHEFLLIVGHNFFFKPNYQSVGKNGIGTSPSWLASSHMRLHTRSCHSRILGVSTRLNR